MLILKPVPLNPELIYRGVTNALHLRAKRALPDESDAVELWKKRVTYLLGGQHFRSFVLLTQGFANREKEWANASIVEVAQQLHLNSITSAIIQRAVPKYLTSCLEIGVADAMTQAESALAAILDSRGAIPPAYLYYAADDDLRELISVLAHSDPKKMVERCATRFDHFKARYGIPVFPKPYTLLATQSAGTTKPRAVLPEAAVFYPPGFVESRDPIFQMNRGKVTVASRPSQGVYHHPSVDNHPLIDRAASDSTGQYVILCQDKINDDAPTAVLSLNAARNLLAADDKRSRRKARQYICVANCIGAGVVLCQKNFQGYYAMITDDDLERFYTPTLAHIFQYLRERHETPADPPVIDDRASQPRAPQPGAE